MGRGGYGRAGRASVSVSVPSQRGASPLQADALRLVADRNCVAARRGGKQRKANDQSATQVNSIRPGRVTSLLASGEVQTGFSRLPATLRGSVSKRSRDSHGGWRRNGLEGLVHEIERPAWARRASMIEPVRRTRHAGVRGVVVARKPGNAGGAKDSRKMDAT
jgi:hypothetical protein